MRYLHLKLIENRGTAKRLIVPYELHQNTYLDKIMAIYIYVKDFITLMQYAI